MPQYLDFLDLTNKAVRTIGGGTSAVSGSVSLTPTAALADGAANSSLYGVAGYGMLFNAAGTWDRARSANAASGTTGTGLLGAGSMVYDPLVTGWFNWRGTAVGGAFVQGPSATGSLATGNPLLLGGLDLNSNVQYLRTSTNGALPQSQFLGTVLMAGIGSTQVQQMGAAGVQIDNSSGLSLFAAGQSLYNGATWDRGRNNQIINQFTGTNTTSGITSHATQTNYNNTGLIATLNITAASGTLPTLDITVQIADGAGTFYNLTDSAGNTVAFQRQITTGTDTLKIAPGLIERLGSVAGRQYSGQLPRSYRFVSTVGGNLMSFTYRLDVSELK